jgi:methylmalonyl-CoA mutase
MASKTIYNAEFPPVDEERWRELARRTLRDADLESLVSHTEDGIRIEPVYRRSQPRHVLRADPARPWRIVQRIDDPDPAAANRQAREEAENGAHGLALVFEGAPNAFGHGIPARREALATVLDGVPLEHIHLRMDAHPASRAAIDWIIDLYGARRTAADRLSFSLGFDPAAILAGTGRLHMSVEALQASLPQSLGHFFALGLPGILMEADGRVWHNAGATAAQELGAMLASAVWLLRMFEEARQPLLYAVEHVGFAMAADQDQFETIAKLRALRLLWARIQEACSIEPQPVLVHVETSWRMLSGADIETNILRNTIAAFSAAVGGADSVSVLPHDLPLRLPDRHAP